MKKKFASLFLVMALVLTMIPASAFAGTAPSLTTDKTTYKVGEPIMVTATSDTDGDWVGLYSEGKADGSSYWFWYYVKDANGKPINICKDAEPCSADYDGWILAPGKYEIRLEKDTTKSVTITIEDEVYAETSLEVESTNVTTADPIKVKATACVAGGVPWVALYKGDYNVDSTFPEKGYMSYFLPYGSESEWKEFEVSEAGTYTIVLFGDGGYTKALDCKTVEVTGEAKEPISTDKTSYKYGEAVKVTTNYVNSGSWVGLYKKGDTPGSGEGTVVSVLWFNTPAMGTETDITDFSKLHTYKDRPEEWFPAPNDDFNNCKLESGDYVVYVFQNGGYTPAGSAEFTIETESYGEPEVTPAGCDVEGSSVQWYTDGTSKSTVIPALSHKWSDWAFDAETRTHSRTCSTSSHAAETGNCTGVAIGEPVIDANGKTTTYQCSVCEGTYKETVASGYEFVKTVVVNATCEEPGETYELWQNAAGETLKLNVVPSPKLGHAYGKWTPAGNGKHKQVCANDATHVNTGDCVYEESYDKNKVVYTCSDCGDTTEKELMTVEKTTYCTGQTIKVTTNYKLTDTDWIGVFYYSPGTRPEGHPNVDSKGYAYITSNPQTFNVNEKAIYKIQADGDDFFSAANGSLISGEYKVAICRNDSGAAAEDFVYLDITILDHQLDEGVVTKEPTCSETGVLKKTCTNGCGYYKNYDIEIDETAHTEVTVPGKVATCKDTGLTDGKKCDVCGVVTVAQKEIPKLKTHGKEVTVPGKDATCKATGLTAGKKCEVCGTITVAQKETPKLAHDSKVTIPAVAATCTAAGKTEGKKCSCGEITVAQKEVAAKGHTFGEAVVTKAPTCTAGGQKVAKCANGCGEQQVTAIAKTGHKIVDVAGKAATCTETGLTAGKKCETCGTWTMTQGVVEKLAHTVASSEITKKATAKVDGEITNKCACGEVVSTDVIAKPVVTLSKAGVAYTGKKVKAPTVKVKDANGNTIAKANYTVVAPKNVKKMKDIGRYVYTVKFKGDMYSGTVKVNFEIKPAKAKIKAPAAAKKAITVKWTKAKKAEKVTGYEVLLATNNKFTKGKKTVTVKGAAKVSKKVTGLKAKTKYFVKVRAYKTVKGVKVYSDYSAVKTIKTK